MDAAAVRSQLTVRLAESASAAFELFRLLAEDADALLASVSGLSSSMRWRLRRGLAEGQNAA